MIFGWKGDLKTTIMPRLMELRTMVRSKFSDPSVLVRRGAFRAAGVWLEECEERLSMVSFGGYGWIIFGKKSI